MDNKNNLFKFNIGTGEKILPSFIDGKNDVANTA